VAAIVCTLARRLEPAIMSAARHLPAALLILAVLVYPVLFQSGFALGAAIVVAGLAVGAVGLVPLLGLAHQLAIGQAAFYMIGGYGSAILTGWCCCSGSRTSSPSGRRPST
jgi:branched-chain amino acid transport system permease protein